MKVLGFVIIVIGLIMVWVGITGDQHNLMAVITGNTTPVASGQSINPSGSGSGGSATSDNTSSSNTNAASEAIPPGSVSED